MTVASHLIVYLEYLNRLTLSQNFWFYNFTWLLFYSGQLFMCIGLLRSLQFFRPMECSNVVTPSGSPFDAFDLAQQRDDNVNSSDD